MRNIPQKRDFWPELRVTAVFDGFSVIAFIFADLNRVWFHPGVNAAKGQRAKGRRSGLEMGESYKNSKNVNKRPSQTLTESH